MQPGNYTLELYLQDIGQLATWKGSQNKRHGSHGPAPGGFPVNLFRFVCVRVFFLLVTLCSVCFFYFSRKIKATVVIKNNGMTTKRLVLLNMVLLV